MNFDSLKPGDQVMVQDVSDFPYLMEVGTCLQVRHFQGSPRVSMAEIHWGTNQGWFSNGDTPTTPEERRQYLTLGQMVLVDDPQEALRMELDALLYTKLSALARNALGPKGSGCKTITQGLLRLDSLAKWAEVHGVPAGVLSTVLANRLQNLQEMIAQFAPTQEPIQETPQDGAMVPRME